MASKKKERERQKVKGGRKCHSRRGATLKENWKKQARREERKGAGWRSHGLKPWGEVFAKARREEGNESEPQLGENAKNKNTRVREVIFIRSSDCHHNKKKQYQQPERKCKQQPTTTDSILLQLLLFCGDGGWPQPRTIKRRLPQLQGCFIKSNSRDEVNNNNCVKRFGYDFYNYLFCALSYSKRNFFDKLWWSLINLNVISEKTLKYKFLESRARNYKVYINNNNNNNNNAFSSVCVFIWSITCSEDSAFCNTTISTTTTTTTHPHSCRQDKKRYKFLSLFYPEKTVPPAPSKLAQGYHHHPGKQLSKCYARWSVDFCRATARTVTADLIVRSGGSARRLECRLKIASYEDTDASKNTDVSSSPFFPGRKKTVTKEQKTECHGIDLSPTDITGILLTNIRLISVNCFCPGLDSKKSDTKKGQLLSKLRICRRITSIKITGSPGRAKFAGIKISQSVRRTSHKVTIEKAKNKQRSIVFLSRQYTRRNYYWSYTTEEENNVKRKYKSTSVVGEKRASSKRNIIRSVDTVTGTTTSIFKKEEKSYNNCIGACGIRKEGSRRKRRSSSRGSSSQSDRESSSKRGKTSRDHLSKDCQGIVDAKNGSSEPTGILSITTSSEWTQSYHQRTFRMETTSPGILNQQGVSFGRLARDTNNNVRVILHNFTMSYRDTDNHCSQPINAADDDYFDNKCLLETSAHELCTKKGPLHPTARPLEIHQTKPAGSKAPNSTSPENTSTARSPQSASCDRHNNLIRPDPRILQSHHNHHPNQQQKQQQQQQHFPYRQKNKNDINISYYYEYFCDCSKRLAKRINRILPKWGKSLLSVLLVFQLVGSSILTSAVPVTKKKTSDEVKGMNYLTNFGYVSGPSQEAENLMSESVKIESIKRFQMFANLPVTGVFDHRTMEMMEKPRCGNSDKPVLNDWDTGRRKRYILSESVWGRTNLTFRFLNYTPDINFPKIRKAIYDALFVWSRVTHLTFTEIMFESNNGKDADIRIQFAKSFHNDGYPFDGEGIILAHAFFPGENKGGDTHFDDDEHWTVDSDEGVNLFMVAAHEFGHALGLSHSKTSGSLMYPWYQGKQSKGYQLPQDDVDGIQKLYGVKNGNETFDILVREYFNNNDDPRDTDEEEENPHGNCTHTFDAITKIRGDVYIFKGKYFWRWTSGGLKDSKPILISHFWYHFPEESIDAAFERKRDSKIMFFKGDKYWLYDANHMERGWPMDGRPLVELGLPVDLKKIDAAFTWSFNKRTYLVSNDMYWKFDEMESYMVYDYPRSMTIWHGVPTPLDAAFQFTDNKTYFIKGKHYWEYNDQKMRVKNRAPSGNIAERWMQCPSQQRRPVFKSGQKRVEATGSLLLFLSLLNKHILA